MEAVLAILVEYQWLIYSGLGIILLLFLRRALLARRDGARSLFKLEQEQARTRYSRSVAISAFILLLMAGVFVISNPVLSTPDPTPAPAPTATETSGPLAASTLTPTPPPATITNTATPTRARPTRPTLPTETPSADSTEIPAIRPAACPAPNVCITSPGVNQVVQGNIPVRGTATIADFQYYKVEVGPGSNPADNEWTVVGSLHQSPVSGGVLETFNGSAYPPGTYTLRLVVVDQTGNYPPPCRITVIVQR
jgi:hypothetical protein